MDDILEIYKKQKKGTPLTEDEKRRLFSFIHLHSFGPENAKRILEESIKASETSSC